MSKVVMIHYSWPMNGRLLVTADSKELFELRMEDAILLQSISLEDKHDVDVYEGDVVDGGYYSGVVVFINGAFQVRGIEGDTHIEKEIHYFGPHGDHWNTGVVGNIYENPDLIEGRATL